MPIARQRELDAAIGEFDEADWMHIGNQVVSNPALAREILGYNVVEEDYATRMVEIMKQKKKADAEQKAKAKRDKPPTPAQQRNIMREFVKNQSGEFYNRPWTKKQVWSISDEQLVYQYNRIKGRLHKDGIFPSPQLVPSLPAAAEEPSSKRL